MSPTKRKTRNNNNNNTTPHIRKFPRQHPPSTIKRRIHQKQQELHKEYPTNSIHLQHLETIPPPKNKKAVFNTYTYRFGSIMHPELRYNMLHTYPNPNYISPIQSPLMNLSPVRSTLKIKSTPKNKKKSHAAHKNYMNLIHAYEQTHVRKN